MVNQGDGSQGGRSDGYPNRKPSNLLGRPFWTVAEARNAREAKLGHLAGASMGVASLSRLLANSEAFRDQQANNHSHPPTRAPLRPDTTEGLFAALYFLAKDVEEIGLELLEEEARGKNTSAGPAPPDH